MFQDGRATMSILGRVIRRGLTLSGLRLLYPTSHQLHLVNNTFTTTPVLCLALRGVHARSVWIDVIGPSDPVLARRTDPMSLCAQYGGQSRDTCLLFCPRTPTRTAAEIVRWFGCRVAPLVNVNTNSSSTVAPLVNRTVTTLVCHTQSSIFLVISPLILSRYLGLILDIVQQCGFQLTGVRRLFLTDQSAAYLGIYV